MKERRHLLNIFHNKSQAILGTVSLVIRLMCLYFSEKCFVKFTLLGNIVEMRHDLVSHIK